MTQIKYGLNSKKTPMMSTYKLSFVLGKFKTTQVNNSLRMWSTKTAIDYEENFMRIGQKTWNILEDITGISSNEQFLEKLDFVIIPRSSDLSRYMNGIYPSYNWELCIVNEGDLKEKTYTEALPNLLTYQWFINSIAPDNFHFQSFEHGLSVYIPTFIADKIDESSDWMDQFSFYCREKLDKYASMIRMIATLFGKERFRNAIKSYLLNNNFGELTSTTLIDEFINAS
ncbi:uncharacterized protein LOC123275314 [Cotesia glomerata]|uniref:uncharacterized protein LOC123275314 n=1 Tax=Cotesia glomerata TaxID=32391 RepID=UPI001D034C04|nr:uncharacterized protein LOC123275314 [Cotesia glomerata]